MEESLGKLIHFILFLQDEGIARLVLCCAARRTLIETPVAHGRSPMCHHSGRRPTPASALAQRVLEIPTLELIQSPTESSISVVQWLFLLLFDSSRIADWDADHNGNACLSPQLTVQLSL